MIRSWLSEELAKIYSTTISFSAINLGYMQKFYAAYPDVEIVQTLLAQLPWDYHIVLLEQVSTYEERIYYASLVVEHGWGVERLNEEILSDRN